MGFGDGCGEGTAESVGSWVGWVVGTGVGYALGSPKKNAKSSIAKSPWTLPEFAVTYLKRKCDGCKFAANSSFAWFHLSPCLLDIANCAVKVTPSGEVSKVKVPTLLPFKWYQNPTPHPT